MRVAFLSTFYPFRGGIAQFNALLYKAVERQGHEVKAFTFTCQYPSFLFPGKTQYLTDADEAIPIDSEAVLNTANPFSYQTAVNKIACWKPDVLILRYWMTYFAPSLGHVANRLRKKGVKVICIVDNALPHESRFFDKPLSTLFLRQCSAYVVMSDVVKDDLLRLNPKAYYRHLPHPLYDHFGEKVKQSTARESLSLPTEKKTLLFFGLIRDYKGLDWLIRAMSLLDDSYQLLIAGECYGSFDKYDELIKASPAHSRIRVYNEYIDDKRVPAFFSAADLLILPYKSATQSGVISIAYHFDLPVLATDVGGLRASLEPNGTGLICHPSVESIASGIREFFDQGSKGFVAAISKEKERLSWERFAGDILSL